MNKNRNLPGTPRGSRFAASALVAVAPRLLTAAGQVPWASLGVTLLLVFLVGLAAGHRDLGPDDIDRRLRSFRSSSLGRLGQLRGPGGGCPPAGEGSEAG